jgi:hypothetical protein
LDLSSNGIVPAEASALMGAVTNHRCMSKMNLDFNYGIGVEGLK